MKKSLILASALTMVIGFNAVTSAPTEHVSETSAGYNANATILGFGGGISGSFGSGVSGDMSTSNSAGYNAGASLGFVSGGASTSSNTGYNAGVSAGIGLPIIGSTGWGQSVSTSSNLDLGEGSILSTISKGKSFSN